MAGSRERVTHGLGVVPREVRRPADQPADLAEAAVALSNRLGVAVAEQVSRGDQPVVLDRDQRAALGDPRVDDQFIRLALELAQHGVGRHRHTRDHRLDVAIDQGSELVAIAAAERAHLNGRHERTSKGERTQGRFVRAGGRYLCGTGPRIQRGQGIGDNRAIVAVGEREDLTA
ncbi:hypothetical protein ABZV93_21760 [Actinopolymorpha sp. NPDC004070]|uniref:hypothetical protein n=1 Tax=Actinopolymorpha sp. NPDC004070 TaxID=3154548 RepID=UPI0033AFC4F5